MMRTETFQQLISIALDEFSDKHSGGTTQWEFEANKSIRMASRDFILFLNKMVIDRIEKLEDDDDGSEPEHAPATE